MSDLLYNLFSTVGTNAEQGPATIASTTTIAPVGFLTFVSGTTDIATITPPTTGWCVIGLVFTTTSPGSLVTTGNISVGSTTLVQNKLNLLCYSPTTNKWYLNS